MTVVDPGHIYTVDTYDGSGRFPQWLTFMKRVGPVYPGNTTAHPGTNIQEVLRVLIDRVKYLNNQIPCFENTVVLSHLRFALHALESRAAKRHGLVYTQTEPLIEDEVTCKVCGHIVCKHKETR